MIAAIARHELRSLFLSPLAWIVLALVQLLLAYIFLLNIDAFIAGQEELALKPGAPGATLLVVVKTLFNVPTVLMIVALREPVPWEKRPLSPSAVPPPFTRQ